MVETTELQDLLIETEKFKKELIVHIGQYEFLKSPKSEMVLHTFDILLEHSDAINVLIKEKLLVTCVSVFRIQFDALVRQLWYLYVAKDSQIENFSVLLTNDNFEKLNRTIPSTKEMLDGLEASAPTALNKVLKEFKENSTKVLGSLVHSGVFAIAMKRQRININLICSVLKQSNNLVQMAVTGLAILGNSESLAHFSLNLVKKYPDCFQLEKT